MCMYLLSCLHPAKQSTHLILLILKLCADITKCPNKINCGTIKLQQSTVCSFCRVSRYHQDFKSHERYSPPEVRNWIRRSLFVQMFSLFWSFFPFIFLSSFLLSFLLSFSLPFFFPRILLYKKENTKSTFVVLNDMLPALPLELHWMSLFLLF